MIEIETGDFRRAIDAVAPAIVKRGNFPILGQVRLTANGACRIAATDLDMMIMAKLPYAGRPADFMLPSPVELARALKATGARSMQMQAADGTVSIVAGPANYALDARAKTDDWPAFSALSEDVRATVGEAFIAALRRLQSSVSIEETRYYLNGVFMRHLGDWRYALASTDGHRLQEIVIALPDATVPFKDMIIPGFAVRALLAQRWGDAPIVLTQGRALTPNRDATLAPEPTGLLRVRFESEALTVETRLIDGNFPDYTRVIPKDIAHGATIESGALRKALAMLRIGKTRSEATRLTLRGNTMTLSRLNAELGTFSTSLAVERATGAPDFETGFNGRYIDEMAQAAGGERMQLAFGASSSDPVLVLNPDDTAWKGVIMPMRV